MILKKNLSNKVGRELIIIKNRERGISLMEDLDEKMSFPHSTEPEGLRHVYRNMNAKPEVDVWHIKGSTVEIEYEISRNESYAFMDARAIVIIGKDKSRMAAKKYLEQSAGGNLE